MTYLGFLCVFLGIPIGIMAGLVYRSRLPHKKTTVWGITTLTALAVLYTTPWDNYLVANEVWWYGKDRVLGVIGHVPIEEYMFFVLQTVLTGIWCYLLQSRIKLVKTANNTILKKWVGALYGALFIFGLACLTQNNYLYLGLILSWAMPILIFQWFMGGQYIVKNYKFFIVSVLVPSFYLWFADAFAIWDNIWTISERFTVGVSIGNLPIEEAIFFFVTNLIVAQGLILFITMEEEVQTVLALKRKWFN